MRHGRSRVENFLQLGLKNFMAVAPLFMPTATCMGCHTTFHACRDIVWSMACSDASKSDYYGPTFVGIFTLADFLYELECAILLFS